MTAYTIGDTDRIEDGNRIARVHVCGSKARSLTPEEVQEVTDFAERVARTKELLDFDMIRAAVAAETQGET